MRATYDPEVDVLYVTVNDVDVDHTADVSQRGQYDRGIDYAADGSLVGYEFMNASRGIDLEGLPHRDELTALLAHTRSLDTRKAG
jgi:uncharacterized protein YuzE